MGSTAVQNRYPETMRVWRLYRLLQSQMSFGFGHEGKKKQAGAGDLTWRCVACPRAGVNLPAEWKSKEDSWKYFHAYSIDTNFKAAHDESRVPENDRRLQPEGFIVDHDRLEEATKLGIVDEVRKASAEKLAN